MFNRTVLLAVVVGLVVGGGAVSIFATSRERAAPAPIIINTPAPAATIAPTATAGPIQVFVNGAVVDPDVYVLPPDSRVKQAVEAAGGFTEEANRAIINLAQPLTDGVHIYVPDRVDSTEVPGQVVSEPDVQSRSSTIELSGAALININTAGIEELDRLPGIGPVIAQKIIDYRAANGSFPTIEAILDVSGIGETKFQQIRDLITTGN